MRMGMRLGGDERVAFAYAGKDMPWRRAAFDDGVGTAVFVEIRAEVQGVVVATPFYKRVEPQSTGRMPVPR